MSSTACAGYYSVPLLTSPSSSSFHSHAYLWEALTPPFPLFDPLDCLQGEQLPTDVTLEEEHAQFVGSVIFCLGKGRKELTRWRFDLEEFTRAFSFQRGTLSPSSSSSPLPWRKDSGG